MRLRVMSEHPVGNGKVNIKFDDGTDIILYKGEMRRLGIQEGCDISEDTYRTIMEDILKKRAIKRAMHLLERQERTERQLFEKLSRNGYPNACIEAAISYVKSYRYVDDRRYAQNYIRFHQQKKSRQKLKLELMAKGVPREFVEQALETEYASDEQAKIRELLQKRHYSFGTRDEGEKRKNYQFLLRRGFKSSDILCVMSRYEKEEDVY